MDKQAPVVVARTSMNSEASVIKSLLESYQIPCYYTAELPHRLYPLSGEGLAEIRIYVAAPVAERARQVLEAHRRHTRLRLVEPDEQEEAGS